jgi:hypothetical protein
MKVHAVSRHFSFRYRSAGHFLHVFRTWYGPMNRAFAALESDPDRQAALSAELLDLVLRADRSRSGAVVLPSEYLEVVVERRRMRA